MADSSSSPSIRWAFGTYKLRNGTQANITSRVTLYLYGTREGGYADSWNTVDGRHISDPNLDLVELIRSDKYDKYAR